MNYIVWFILFMFMLQKKRDLSNQRDETIKQMKESEVKFESRKQQLAPHHSNLRVRPV